MNYALNAYTLSECMEVMADYVERFELEGQRNVIFCEDRLTLVAERALTRRMGGTFSSSVTTFARFLSTDEKVLSKQGSVMAIGKIMYQLQKSSALRCFTSERAIENSAKCVYETLAQIASSEITPDALQESALLLGNDILKDKVCDLALIYREYTAFLSENGYLDESKYLALLPQKIRLSGELQDANVFFLCFNSFTAQALQSVRAVIENAKNVVGIFCAGKESIYTNHASMRFKSVCEEYGEVYARELGQALDGEAEILRKGLFDLGSLKLKEKTVTENIRLREAKDLSEESEYVALQIKKLVANGSRYRDFAVLIPDVATYALPIKRAFSEYGVPYFFDEKKSLKSHPLCGFLLACLETVRDGFSSTSAQALAQNVFFGESDEYRNYLLKYANFRGGALKPIKETDAFDLLAVNDGRERFLQATKNIKRRGQGREYCNAIRRLAEDFKLKDKIEELKSKVKDSSLQGYLSQIFSALDKVLAEAETLTAEEEMSVGEFQSLLSEGLGATELSLIPLKTDAVFVGDICCSRIEKVKTLFAMGMTDAVPCTTNDTALISDKELEKIENIKTLLEPTVAQVNIRTRESVALNLCTFTDKLFLSYPLGSDGSLPVLSDVIGYVKALYKTKNGELTVERTLNDDDFIYCCSAKLPAVKRRYVEQRLYTGKIDDTRKRAISLSKALVDLGVINPLDCVGGGQVSVENGEELFFRDGKVSPTMLETYFACPFKNFVSNGLRAKEREESLVLAVDTGNFLHTILEKMAKEIDNIANENDAREFARKTGEELLTTPLYSAQGETVSGKYFSKSLLKEGEEVAVAVYRQIVGSDFKVDGVETKIETDEFNGKIDRLDSTDKFVRIIDYKTGAVKADPTDYYTGRKIQIQLYMSAIKGDKIPAGVFYFPASVEYKKESESAGRYRLLGYINGDKEALKAGDREIQEKEKSPFFEASLSDNARLEKVMNGEQFENFIDYAPLVAMQARKELKDGFVQPTPYSDVCRICRYGGACGWDFEKKPRLEKAVKPSTIAEIAKREKEKI
ncbi:MAG: hypothetical protein E7343_04405 [Clostridiales bacterium]|nr:hypothetical protein [Clostridiales bacterium]